ncbi:MAG: hypothetical protein H7252_07235 [Cytophaga sp.]|nr:hypothetical protein [Undibacterium sp.]
MEIEKNMKKGIVVCFGLLWFCNFSIAGVADIDSGPSYSNFGNDLFTPIFPKNNSIKIFKNKEDIKPIVEFNDTPVVHLEDAKSPCLKGTQVDGWVRCNINGTSGWVKRSEFLSPKEYQPIEKWPFRYWMYVASEGGGEEAMMLYLKVPRNPYLIAPKQFANVFFLTYFDEQGFAISAKTNKKTGERIFTVGDAVYLAPADPVKREKTDWLFLAYFNADLIALCPARNPDSCYSAVNLSQNWNGIKEFYTSAKKPFFYDSARQAKEKETWFGKEMVAFGRHSDPIVPFMYHVPDEVLMTIDPNPRSDEQRIKNREKPFCLLDCKGAPNPIVLNPKPAN